MEDLKIDVNKAMSAGIRYIEGVPQVNMDGSPITSDKYIRVAGDRFKVRSGGGFRIVDHQPTPDDLTTANLIKTTPESSRKAQATRKARKTAQDSLKFLLSCAAEPAEARGLIRTLTGGEPSETMKAFFDQQDGDESDLTQYDLINLAMITAAKNGDTKAALYVRDTVGDKLAEKQEIAATFTDGDKSLLEKVSARLAILSGEYLTPEIMEAGERESERERSKERDKENT